MKILRYYLLTAVIALASLMLSSCSKSFLPEDMSDVLPTSTSEEIDFNVSLDAATKMAERLSEGKHLSSIKPYVRGEDTLFYIANYSDGWKLISGDMRTISTLAEDDKGSYSSKVSSNTGLEQWSEDLADYLQSIKHSPAAENCDSNIRFWDSIRGIARDQDGAPILPNYIDPTDTSEIGEGFRWVRIAKSSSVQITDVNFIDHLLSTVWGEGVPWNSSFPITEIGSTTKLKARSAPVALAQLLYYFHYSYGKPTSLIHGSTMGYIPYTYNGQQLIQSYTYQQGQTVENSSRWDDMPLVYTSSSNIEYVSEFLMDLGNYLYIDFTDPTQDILLLPGAFTQFGISCSKASFDRNTIEASLSNGIPVLVYGATSRNFIHPGYHDYWTWIIDGRTTKAYYGLDTFEWQLLSHLSNVPTFLEPGHTYYTQAEAMAIDPDLYPGKIEEVHSYQSLNYWLINWGCNHGDNSGLYSMGQDWGYPNKGDTFKYDKTMIYGFQ